jgi:small subunit ribosomal protein S17
MSEAVTTEATQSDTGGSKSIKERQGTVVADKMNKTIVVRVTRRVPHPLYKKIIKISKRLYVHDENSEAKVGDTVRVVECRPISKTKRWQLKEIIKH